MTDTLDGGEDGDAVGADPDTEHDRGTFHVGQQARRIVGQALRVQGGPAVGEVDGDTPSPRLLIDRAARFHEARHIGDGVRQHHVVGIHLDEERLIEIGARDRVERDEVDIAPIDRPCAIDRCEEIRVHGVGGTVGFGQHVGREVTRQREVGADAIEPRSEFGGHFRGQRLERQRRAPMNMPFSAS